VNPVSNTARKLLLVGLAVVVITLLGMFGFLALGGDGDSERTAASADSSSSSIPTSTTSDIEAGTDTSSTHTSAAPGADGDGGGGIAGPVAPERSPDPAPPPAPIVLEAEIDGSSACTSETAAATITVFWRTRNATTVRLIIDPPSSFVTIDKQVPPIDAEQFGPYFCGPYGEPRPWSARLIATAADGTVTERVFFGDHRD
jgi:hypothetical protein